MASDDPAFLAVGTAVSAKYKGAFCESIVKKIDKNVKCKITYKEDNKTAVVSDEDIQGQLKVGSTVEVKKGDSSVEAIINRITDHSIYHVLFDDGDENSLKRSKLCPKGDRHFTKSTTLDGYPLTHPERFWSPVIKREKKTPTTPNQCSDSDESSSEANTRSDQELPELSEDFFCDRRQDLVGRIVYSMSDGPRKGQLMSCNGAVVALLLVVLPGADGNAPSSSKVLAKSLKDSRFINQSINSLKCLTLDDLRKFKDKCPKMALDRASAYLTKNELPSSWDRLELLGYSSDDDEDDENDEDDDDYDDEYSKKKSSEMSDRFVAELYRFTEERGSPINCVPTISNMELDLYKLFHIVQHLGGNNKVTNQAKWHIVHRKMNFDYSITLPSEIKAAYKEYLHAFEDLDRKLGRFRSSSWSSKVTVGNRSIMSFRDRDHELSSSVKNNRVKKRKEEAEKVETEPTKDTPEINLISDVSSKFPMKSLKADLSDDISVGSSNEDPTSKDQCQRYKSTTKPEIHESKRKFKQDDTEPDSTKNVKIALKESRKKIKVNEEGEVGETKSKDRPILNQQSKVKRIMSEPKLPKDSQPVKLESKDGRLKRRRLEDKKDATKLKDARSLKVKDMAAAGSVSSKDGKDEEEEDVGRKRKMDMRFHGDDEKRDRMSRRILRRGNNNEGLNNVPKDNTLKKPNHDVIYPVGTRLKVRYGDGKNTKIYGAKILELKQRNEVQLYLVHYNGWNSRYDDWISPDQIVDVLEESSEDQVPLLPPKPARSTNIIKSQNRLNRYHRLSSCVTMPEKGDGDKIKSKKRIESSDSNSDSDSNMGSDLNSEKGGSILGKASNPEVASESGPNEKGDNVVDAPIDQNLDVDSNLMKLEAEECNLDPKLDPSVLLLAEMVGSDSNVSADGDGQTCRKEEIFFDQSDFNSLSIGLGLNENQHSPIFQNSAFTRKDPIHKTQIAEDRSVWKDDGRLNLNLAESPIKTPSHSLSNSPIFDSFQKKSEGFKFEVGDEKGKADEEEDNEESERDKNSPLETASSEGGVGEEENASTKSDREANREVEAYMTADYTILDRKADYVMLNRLPGDAASYYVPSLDDSSDASSTGRIACPKPILPYTAASTWKEELARKRKKDGKELHDASDSEIDLQKMKMSKSNLTPIKKLHFDSSSASKHEHHNKKRSYNSITRSLGKYNNLNFVDLDALKGVEGEERIEWILGRIQDLRTVYMELKADVACIDRRRRKHRDKNKDASIFTCSENIKT